MKKRIVVGASLVALVLSVSLFAISVFAAVGQAFGVNNTIKFAGATENMIFDLTATVSGTTKDGDSSLTYTWNYSYETSTTNNQTWNVPDNLVFDEKDKVLNAGAENRVAIIYTFSITNKSANNQSIRVYVENVNIDTSVLIADINGSGENEVIIGVDDTDSISVALVPIVRFSGAKTCDFNIKMELITE